MYRRAGREALAAACAAVRGTPGCLQGPRGAVGLRPAFRQGGDFDASDVRRPSWGAVCGSRREDDGGDGRTGPPGEHCWEGPGSGIKARGSLAGGAAAGLHGRPAPAGLALHAEFVRLFRTTPDSTWRVGSRVRGSVGSMTKKWDDPAAADGTSERAAEGAQSGAGKPGSAGVGGAQAATGISEGHFSRPVIRAWHGDDRALRAIYVALAANTAIMGSKVMAYVWTGSSSMMAEAIHSLADVCNQGLLWYGIRSTQRQADKHYNYGYMRERYVWSLISAVGILCMGSGVTLIHGVHGMMEPEPIEHVGVGVAVLAASLALEGASLVVAVRALSDASAEKKMTLWRYIQKGQDPTSIAVMMEDIAAVSGLCIAGGCLVAAAYTGNPIFDSLGSVMVAGLLGTIATFLIQKNRAFLVGRSMDHQDTGKILAHIQADCVVKAIHDVKTEEVGPGIYRFKAEIEFDGEQLVERHLTRTGRSGLLQLFRSAASDGASDKAIESIVKQYGEAVVEALGDEVDRLEEEIITLVPGIRHVDIEAY